MILPTLDVVVVLLALLALRAVGRVLLREECCDSCESHGSTQNSNEGRNDRCQAAENSQNRSESHQRCSQADKLTSQLAHCFGVASAKEAANRFHDADEGGGKRLETFRNSL